MSLVYQPITLREARRFVELHHRHHGPPRGGLFAIAVSSCGPCLPNPVAHEIRGVAIVGRPVSRMNQDGWTAEVTRLATLGDKNACSMLYSASWRAARAIGYRRLITYTLISEDGVSVRAAGFRLVGVTKGGSWSRPGRPRVDTHPTEQKRLWEVEARI